jgi:type I restriction enzyme S subunit
LGDVVQINPRVGTERASADLPVSFVAMAAVCEHTGSIVSSEVRPFGQVSKGFPIFAENDVLFAKITPCMENGKAAIARNLENGTGAGSTEFFVLRPTSRILSEYVFHFMRRTSFRATCKANFTGSAGQQRVPKSFLEKVAIPLPPLDEQRRIVGLLDRAAEIRRRTDAARSRARAIIPALFLDTFGDPATNPKGWPIGKVGEAGEVKLGRQRAPKYQSGKFTRPYVRVANVFESQIDVSDLLSMDFDEREFPVYRLEYGDVLLNEGQSIELVGRPAMWRDEVEDCCFQNTLVRFRCDRRQTVPEYALAAFLQMYHDGQLSKIASKTSNVAHLGAGRFAKLPMMLPPLPLQKTFAEQAQRLEALARALDAACAKAEAMAAALSAEMFGQGQAYRRHQPRLRGASGGASATMVG